MDIATPTPPKDAARDAAPVIAVMIEVSSACRVTLPALMPAAPSPWIKALTSVVMVFTATAPVPLTPEDQATFSGDKAFIVLEWQPVANMPDGAQYQVTMLWAKGGAPQQYAWETTSTNSRVPLGLWLEADQPARRYTWFVTVVLVDTDGQGGKRVTALSPPSVSRTFSWN